MEKFGLREEITRGIRSLGYTALLPVQEKVIPAVLEGHDCLVQAETGAGKTAAFLIPVLNNAEPFSTHTQALIIAPTRELAVQIHETAGKLAAYSKIHVICVIGGMDQSKQENALKNHPDVVIGTPGRLADLVRQELIDLSHLQYLVIDEADQIVSTGQAQEFAFLREHMPDVTTVCASATMNEMVVSYVKEDHLSFVFSESEALNQKIREYYLIAEDKTAALMSVLKSLPVVKAIVFANMKTTVSDLNRLLQDNSILSSAFSSADGEKKRLRTIKAFRNGDIRVLCATDAAARGLDIMDVSHIVHYDPPFDPETYIHRSGRTAHQQNEGITISLLSQQEADTWIPQDAQPLELNAELGNDLSVPLQKESETGSHPCTVLIRAGRKEKIRPGDIAGALSSVIDFKDIGTIEIQDTYATVIILNHDLSVIDLLQGLSIKGKKRKIELKKDQ